MKRLFPFFLLLILTACSRADIPFAYDLTGPEEFNPDPTLTPFQPQEATPMDTDDQLVEKNILPTSIPLSTPTPDWEIKRYLLLGGDWRDHRRGTKWGNKTDIMLLVQIKYDPDNRDIPAEIDLIQFPRNFWTPVRKFPDVWLFAVYRLEGFPGLHYYFQEVFDVPIDAVFYIHMDNFIVLYDGLFPEGIVIPDTNKDIGIAGANGNEMLRWIRDNDNNWGCPEYDCGDRQMRASVQLGEAFMRKFKNSPMDVMLQFWHVYGKLFETDISAFDQIRYGAMLIREMMNRNYQLQMWKMTTSAQVEYGDTPLEIRGWIIKEEGNLPAWIWKILR